ncbi:MAG: MaoC family dehydratase N-terminal domain-containing protein, partial [Hyphomonadaceae bacterium]
LKFFAKATGETDPIYFDEAAAQAAGHPSLPAPPTWLFSMALSAPAKRGGLFDADNGIGVDMSRVLHGEQSFAYHRPIHAGDRLALTTTTKDIYARKGGALEFIVQDTQATNEAGELCVEMRMVTVVRNG